MMLIIGASAIGLLIIGVAWWVGTFNRFQVARQDIKTQWSNIKTEYQRRADLILNLASTVKSFKNHEKATLLAVAEARGGKFGATKLDERASMGAMDALLQRLMVVVEAYPVLKSDASHSQLMTELRVTEDRINIARTDYNGTVRDYNIMVKQIPTSVVASRYDFSEELFFELQTKGAENAPVVNLE